MPKAGKKLPSGGAKTSKSGRRGDEFGHEGTNKTVPEPQPDAQASDALQGTKTKFIPKSPHTRG